MARGAADTVPAAQPWCGHKGNKQKKSIASEKQWADLAFEARVGHGNHVAESSIVHCLGATLLIDHRECCLMEVQLSFAAQLATRDCDSTQ